MGAIRCWQDRQQVLATPQHALTCSRILLTVSPFCGERNMVGGQVQGSLDPAVPWTPNLTFPMMLPISCKGRDEGGPVSRQLPACHIPPLPTAWQVGNPCPVAPGTLGGLLVTLGHGNSPSLA